MTRRWITALMAASVTLTSAPAVGQSGSPPAPEDTVVADLVVVAPASGPAWWKVSRGDASVWILGLTAYTPRGMAWDKSTLQRRLKGARLVLGVYNEGGDFMPGVQQPLLPPDLKEEVGTLTAKLRGKGARPTIPPIRRARGTVVEVMQLRFHYAVRNELGFGLLKDVEDIARRARVPMVTPPVVTHTWSASALAPENPIANRCIRALINEVSTPPERHAEAAALWAKGDVRGMLEVTPQTAEPDCAYLWPGLRERTIAFQTSLIAQALDRPGKVIAVAHIKQLVAQDGILERLRAEGFTIADPSKPLEE